MGKIKSVALALTAAVVTTVAPPFKAEAADYPKKPVAMIVAYSPGGGTDSAARVIAKDVKPHLGQRLVIQNKPGAGGQIGFTSLATAKNDGYKIGFINVPSIFMVKMLRDNVPYEMSDFEAIANIQLDPVVASVPSASSATSHIENGRLRALAVFADKRYKYLPDVPTVAEATGVTVPGIGASMRGVAVPKGMDAETKKIIEDAFAKVMNDPEFLAYADKMGLPLHYMSAAEFDAYLADAASSVEAYIPLLK